MVETRSGTETSPYSPEQQAKMVALVKENKERREREKQAKLKAIANEQAAKMKRLEEEMKRVQQEEEERRKVAEAEAAAEEEKERMRIESGEGSSGGTMKWETNTELEKKISEWVANLSLGEDEEAESYVTKDEKAALAAELLCMNDLFRPWLDKFVVVYLDDILVFSKTLQEHQGHLRQVLEKLREANFKINVKKCEWAKTHVLDGDGIKPEDSKIAAIRDWSTPRTLTELRLFLGLANYYRKFVRNFSTIAAPLRRLLKKETIWQWDKDCTSPLKKLKRALIEYLVLKVADPSLPFVVTTDASQYGIGAVLQQDDGNGYRPVEFMSARMPCEKVATSTYERELYALRQALDHWKHYLLGRHFKVYSDHETLRWLKTQAKMTPKLTRWAAEIDQFDFELKPVKGKYNVVADALSRRSDYFGAVVHYLDIGRDLQEKVKQAYTQDNVVADALSRRSDYFGAVAYQRPTHNNAVFSEEIDDHHAAAASSSDGGMVAALPPKLPQRVRKNKATQGTTATGAGQQPWTAYKITKEVYDLRQKPANPSAYTDGVGVPHQALGPSLHVPPTMAYQAPGIANQAQQVLLQQQYPANVQGPFMQSMLPTAQPLAMAPFPQYQLAGWGFQNWTPGGQAPLAPMAPPAPPAAPTLNVWYQPPANQQNSQGQNGDRPSQGGNGKGPAANAFPRPGNRAYFTKEYMDILEGIKSDKALEEARKKVAGGRCSGIRIVDLTDESRS
ncbi:hypothetical protein CBR_g6543 [Chara braunii]|uniref:Reverse transcriptase domain-containing protein n=1 Tax=Chara braunii TaxID=69332 RepID=A0A388KK61_CHABU|nr:hypothetical protein CBR_g6543 [Chara braunii]|eukprot:GBG70417.1 hypothetical protein CBR_g6543 [Chara braunii]